MDGWERNGAGRGGAGGNKVDWKQRMQLHLRLGGVRAVDNRGLGACRDWASAYTNTAEEAEGHWLEVTGQLPQDLRGTLYRWDGARTQPQQPGPAQCTGL